MYMQSIMDMQRAKELLPIIQAFSEGKEIEYKGMHDLTWFPCTDPSFFGIVQYRIAKEKKWYRVALCVDGIGDQYTITVDSPYDRENYSEKYVQHQDYFVRWLTDRVYYDVD